MINYVLQFFKILKDIIVSVKKFFIDCVVRLHFSANLLFYIITVFLIALLLIDKFYFNEYYTAYMLSLLAAKNLMYPLFYSGIFIEEHPILFFILFIFALRFLSRLKKKYIRKLHVLFKSSRAFFLSLYYIAFITSINLIILTSVAVCFTNIITNKYIINYNKAFFSEIGSSFSEQIQNFQNAFLKNRGVAYIALNKLIFDLEQDPDYLDTLKFSERLKLCHEINDLIDIQNGPLTPNEHYLRNLLNIAPETLAEMLEEIKNPVDIKWTLMPPEKSALHMFGENGEYNLKFVSEDGFFEAVYNISGELLTENNDPVNMGTYNYADPISNAKKHSTYDVMPYYLWGNTEFSKPKRDSEALVNLEKYYNNNAAMERYSYIQEKIETSFYSA